MTKTHREPVTLQRAGRAAILVGQGPDHGAAPLRPHRGT